MNIKEITELCGFKSSKTLLNWINKNGQNMTMISQKLTEAQKSKKPADFTLEETIEIIRAGGNETLANLLMQNAQSKESADVVALTNRDMILISTVIEKTVSAVVKTFKNEGIFREVKPLEQTGGELIPLPAPVISPRSKANQIINSYVVRTGTEHRIVWGWIYSDFYYAYHINVRVQAENRGMKPIDFIESEGLMSQLLAIVEQRCA